MKKFLTLLALGLLISTSVFAQDIKMITSETLFYIKATHTVPEGAFNNFSVFTSGSTTEMQNQFSNFLKSCQPYNEKININFFGFDATLNIQSNGKINDKCNYEITGKVNNMPEQMAVPAGMDKDNILSLEPKIKCEFSQEQLNMLVDSFTQAYTELASDKNAFTKLDSKKQLKNKILNEDKLKSIFKDGNVCKLVSLSSEEL